MGYTYSWAEIKEALNRPPLHTIAYSSQLPIRYVTYCLWFSDLLCQALFLFQTSRIVALAQPSPSAIENSSVPPQVISNHRRDLRYDQLDHLQIFISAVLVSAFSKSNGSARSLTIGPGQPGALIDLT